MRTHIIGLALAIALLCLLTSAQWFNRTDGYASQRSFEGCLTALCGDHLVCAGVSKPDT
jgi:hypothetical protein